MSDQARQPRRSRRLVAAIATAVITVDAITKAIAANALEGHGIVTVLGGAVHFELYRNHAGPGNILTGQPVIASLLSIAAVIALAGAAWSIRGRGFAVAFGLLLGGGIGNLIDRLVEPPGPLRGGVIDWLKPTLHSGSMNLADVAIDVGVVVLVAALSQQWWRDRQRRRSSEHKLLPVDRSQG